MAEVLDLRRSGLGYRTIAKQLGISRDRVLYICHKNGLGGQIAEAPNITEKAVADYVNRSGFDYIGGYTTAKKSIVVRCRDCGRTFERQAHIFRDVANGTWTAGNECPLCRQDRIVAERKCRQQKKEQEREREAQKRAQCKAERLSREIGNDLEKRLAIHVCKNCGKEFCQMVTGYNSNSYCSEKCQKRWYNRKARDKRDKTLMSRLHDSDICIEKLFERDHGVCYLCGNICDWNDGFWREGTFIAGNNYPSIDHVYPISKGGTHTWNNIKLACRRCNTQKRDNT